MDVGGWGGGGDKNYILKKNSKVLILNYFDYRRKFDGFNDDIK